MRSWRFAAVCMWSLLLLGKTCGNDLGDKRAGEPCTRGSECEEGLICKGGMCAEPSSDGGPDGGG